MNFPQDAGLSCVRYYLREPFDDSLEQATLAMLSGRSKMAARLNCHYCGEVDIWGATCSPSRNSVVATCGCNGSSLPVYIGPPPVTEGSGLRTCVCPNCANDTYAIVIGIGYPHESVPPQGTLEAERAVSLALGMKCNACVHEFVGWHLNLPKPPELEGDEAWLKQIHCFRRK